jgi:PAS domain S-box-containing protein
MDNQKGSVHEVASRLKIFHKIARTLYSSYDLEEIFTQITDSAVYIIGYNTALVLVYNRVQKTIKAQALSTKKKFLPQINKIIGFSLKEFSASIAPDINESVKNVFGGKIVVSSSLEEIAYPVLSKRVCSLAQKLAKTKNYILIPLDIERELAGAIFISSAEERISENELEMLKSFGYIASHVLSTASLLNKSRMAEESLKTEKAYLDQLLESSPEAVVTTDMSGNVIRVNSEFTHIFGYEKEEAVGRCIDDLLAPKDLYKSASSITRLVGRGKRFSLETRRRCKDGTMVDVSLLGSPIEVEGKQVGSYAIYRDISQRKKAERELKESEMIHRALFTYSNDAVFLLDLHGDHVDVNKKAADMLGYEINELLGKSYKDIVAPLELGKAKHKLDELLKNKSFSLYERLFRKKDGTEFPVEVNISLIRDSQNKPRLIQSIVRDITERKKAEQEIKNSLREKGVLLKEIHHRVKNNMQIISSLINLQASKIKDEETASLLKSSQNRIKSMAIIHEKLYQSGDLAKVDLRQYVQSLSGHLLTTYGADMRKIQFSMDIQDIYLDINQAIPCGLIINELLSNCLKHAFPDGGEGKVNISVLRLGEKSTELVVYDNGVGIPADMDIEKTDSLGLTLVKLLSEEQLKGSVDLDRTQGTCFRIVF